MSPVDLSVRVGPVLRLMRLDRGRTVEDAAAEAKLEPGRLASIEAGEGEATPEEIVEILLALGFTREDLVAEVSMRMLLSDWPSEERGANRNGGIG